MAVNGPVQTLRGIGATRLAIMAGITAGLVGFFIFVSTRLATPDMRLLYGDLELDDSSQIVATLEAMGVPYKLGGNGNQILVPSDQVLRLRMTMAQEGLPSGGTIGYEIFDRSASPGTTNFVQRINHLRALEGELARTIRSLDQIAAARVHLVLPRRELFSRDEREPSASIVLKLRGPARLNQAQVRAVQHLASAAVAGLRPGRVSIVDHRGTLLARGVEGNAGEALVSECLAEVAKEPRVVIRISEALLDEIKHRFDEVGAQCGFGGDIVVLGEQELQGSDCRIEWAEGGAEPTAGALEGEIEAIIERFMHDGGAQSAKALGPEAETPPTTAMAPAAEVDAGTDFAGDDSTSLSRSRKYSAKVSVRWAAWRRISAGSSEVATTTMLRASPSFPRSSSMNS